MGFTRAELESYRGAEVPDLLPEQTEVEAGVLPATRLLFVGINPGLWTAATQTHFAHPGNRFYPALLRAGIIDHGIDPAVGMTLDDRRMLLARGIGITNVVRRATARADELSRDELRAGGRALHELVLQRQPRVVAIAGITAYRSAFDHPKAQVGEQAESWGNSRVFVVPNPSGLNAHETIDSLAAAYAGPARVAGMIGPSDAVAQ
ncbi:MAG: mismatch-specific DNA-glycosylase [Nocardioides sp.]